jgi:hypothetical protein
MMYMNAAEMNALLEDSCWGIQEDLNSKVLGRSPHNGQGSYNGLYLQESYILKVNFYASHR